MTHNNSSLEIHLFSKLKINKIKNSHDTKRFVIDQFLQSGETLFETLDEKIFTQDATRILRADKGVSHCLYEPYNSHNPINLLKRLLRNSWYEPVSR